MKNKLIILLTILMVTLSYELQVMAKNEITDNNTQNFIYVKLERVYLDGEVSEEMIVEKARSQEEIIANYEDWSIVNMSDEKIHLRKEIDDISPLLKINGYFGISEDGFLNIYNGRPVEDKVIQSFFQLNTKKLKSYQQMELQEGIPVMSRENYHDILNLYKQYAITEM